MEADEYDLFSLAKRLNITIEDMKEMSFVSLMNVLISSIDDGSNDDSQVKTGTEEDVRKFFG